MPSPDRSLGSPPHAEGEAASAAAGAWQLEAEVGATHGVRARWGPSLRAALSAEQLKERTDEQAGLAVHLAHGELGGPGAFEKLELLLQALEAERLRPQLFPDDERTAERLRSWQPRPDLPPLRPEQQDLVDLIGGRGLALRDGLVGWALVALRSLRGIPGLFGRDTSGRRPLLMRALVATGVQAGPLVALISFLIGSILALQAGAILESFGQTLFIADLVGTSLAKEIGPLMTAILVAGRSGAALCAEIGTMRVSEEIDALEVMGVKPIDWVVSPRLLALMLGLPILVAVADVIGTIGGWAVATGLYRVPTELYLDRLAIRVPPADYLIGLLKGALFAFVIATVAAYQGFRVRGGAAGVGAATTRAVVGAIIWIIIVNALVTLIDIRVLS